VSSWYNLKTLQDIDDKTKKDQEEIKKKIEVIEKSRNGENR
jgi:hypothetical protein